MTTTTQEPIEIDQAVADKLRQWTIEGRGFRLWENQEIGGNAARHVWTPGKTETGEDCPPPNWRYRLVQTLPPFVECRHSEPILTFRGRLKRYYWGTWLTPATEAKAKRLAEKYGGEYRWQFSGYGLADVEIVKTERRPFDAGAKA